MTSVKERLGGNVQARRRAIGMTQVELARALGEAQARVSELENGKTWPGPDRLEAIAAALECDLADLLREPKNA